MNIDEFLMAVSDFEDDCPVVMVSEVSGFYMNPIKSVMMTNFFAENLFQDWVFPFSTEPLLAVVVNFVEVLVHCDVNLNVLISHLSSW
jgi:hypothetical protein